MLLPMLYRLWAGKRGRESGQWLKANDMEAPSPLQERLSRWMLDVAAWWIPLVSLLRRLLSLRSPL